MKKLRVILVKPSKYMVNGFVERFKKGFMPNATLYHIASLTPRQIGNISVTVHTVDEYIWQDLDYLRLLHKHPDFVTLLALVGVQSHQFHRALDLAAYARSNGVRHCVIGGPHTMTCDTSTLQGHGVSFSLAEAELVWTQILEDTLRGELQPVYGAERRWMERLPATVIDPPGPRELSRYWMPMLGLYPVRGCPYKCNFCSVIKISGRQVRSPDLESTLESLRRAKRGGVEMIMFVSDNFNKFPGVKDLLRGMIEEKLNLRFFCQCDTQIARDSELVELLGRARCFEMFVGVESFNRKTLRAANKYHNDPRNYAEIVRLCENSGIRSHFSNIIGFPDDDEEEIKHHLEMLKKLRPIATSFYILTPIPGTEQYDNFRQAGWIVESNLDRFDGSCSTWMHPNLSPQQLEDLLYHCYVDYYRFLLKSGGLSAEDRRGVVFTRYTASNRIHPMAGGIESVRCDSVDEYIDLRRKLYDIDSAPLPDSLPLTSHDIEVNRRANWRLETALNS